MNNLILGENLTDVNNVGKPSLIPVGFVYIKVSILGKSPMNVNGVVNPSLVVLICMYNLSLFQFNLKTPGNSYWREAV